MPRSFQCLPRLTLSTTLLLLTAFLLVSGVFGQLAAQNVTQVPYITTVAGTGAACAPGTIAGCGEGGPATSAQLSLPGVRVDHAGNLYISSAPNNVIWKVDSSGLLTRVVGTGTAGYSGDGGLAVNAQVSGPRGIGFDSAGNVYFSDTGNNVVRKIDRTGIITTVAGTGTACAVPTGTNACGDGGPAINAQFNAPVGLTVDASDNIYIADQQDYRIRKIAKTGTITTVVGDGLAGYSADGQALSSHIGPGVAGAQPDNLGNVYFADFSYHIIRKVDANGNLTTIAGTQGTSGYSADGTLAINARLDSPHSPLPDTAGNLYFADSGNNMIRMIDLGGHLKTVVGTQTACATPTALCGDGGPATSAQLNYPVIATMDGAGNFYIADYNDNRIRKVVTGPVPFFTVPVGTTKYSQLVRLSFNTAMTIMNVQVTLSDYTPALLGSCDPSAATPSAPTVCEWAVQFSPTRPGPRWGSFVVTDGNGNKYSFGMFGIGQAPITTFGPGIISSVAGDGTGNSTGDGGLASSAQVYAPVGLATDSAGNLYFSENGNNDFRIRKIGTNGIINTVAGTGAQGSSGDGGPATAAQLNYPAGIAVDSAGNLYFADAGTDRIRKVDANGTITTVAGGGIGCAQQFDVWGDGCPANTVPLHSPTDVAVDGSGNLFIVDFGSSRILKVDTAGILTTVAGSVPLGADYTGDGIPAISAALKYPRAMTVDHAGALYIADTSNYRIRKVDSAGIITTIAGNGTSGYAPDGSIAATSPIGAVFALTLDAAGNLYLADMDYLVIRKVGPSGTINTVAGLGTGCTGQSDVVGDGCSPLNAIFSAGGLQGLAVDSLGNLYLTDSFHNRVRKITVSNPPSLTFPETYVGGPNSPTQFVVFENRGNANLNITNEGLFGDFNFGLPGSTCSVIQQTLPAAGNCIMGFAFTPTTAGVRSGSFGFWDNSLNQNPAVHQIPLSGTGGLNWQYINSFPNPGTQTYGVAPLTLSATASSGLPVTYAVISGPATVAGNTLTITGAGNVTVQASQAGGNGWAPATPLSVIFTVRPAPLTVTADNKWMVYGSTPPALTYTVTGLVNGESAGDTGLNVLLGTFVAPGVPITITSSTAPGVYEIAIAMTGAFNYSVTAKDGTFTVASLQTPTLTLMNNYFVTGDYIARSVSDTFDYDGSGFNKGLITIPTRGADPEGIPNGAEVVAALLYWQALEDTPTPSSTSALFNGYSITGDQVGGDLASQGACWTGSPNAIMRTYRANVMSYLPVSNGAYDPIGSHSVGIPVNAYTTTANASLVIVYRIVGVGELKATVIYDGNWAMQSPSTSPLNLALRGFYDSDATLNGKISDIVAMVQDNPNAIVTTSPAQTYTNSLTLPDRSNSFAMPNHYTLQSGQCMVWGATVFSTAVKNSDRDGILDAWKTGPSANDAHAGQPGYYSVQDGKWIPLPGAAHGQRDLFVQIDYMVGADGHSHMPSPAALTMVQNAFQSGGVNLLFVTGNAIPEDTCVDDNTTNPPQLCMFPNEPGVVAWKTGFDVLKAWPVNQTACAGGGDCTPRFLAGQKDSYHYVLFGHSLGAATWSLQDHNLTSIQVANNVAMVTTSARTFCPARIMIDGVLSAPVLNGVYNVVSCPDTTTFTIATVGVADGVYPNPSGLPEPLMAIANSVTGTTSGFSELGGNGSAVTLGKWGTQAQRVNVQAGTLMHELGHTMGLGHGGRSYLPESYVSFFGPNCKPNYQSVMNYFFQVDLLGPTGVLNYSGQSLGGLNEGDLSSTPGITGATYSTTKWYSPQPPYGIGTAASYHCNGSAVSPNESPMYLVEGAATPIAWQTSQDLNFDGSNTLLEGYNDWTSIDLQQIGASGDYLDDLSGIKLSGGGGIKLSGGGGIKLSGGGGIKLSGGGGIKLSGGGGIKLSGGGGLKLPEVNYALMDSYVRPPRAVTSTPEANGNLVTWNAPLFGDVQGYTIYRIGPDGVPVIVGTVPSVPGQTAYSFLDTTATFGVTYSYIVSTTLTDGRTSTTSDPPPEPLSQNITFPKPSDVPYNTPDFAPSGSASSTLPLFFSATGSCTIVAGKVHITDVGTCTVTASQPGGAFALPATPVTQSFNVVPANQTITFPAIADRVFSTTTFTVTASASSGLAVTFTSNNLNCTVSSAGQVTMTHNGPCTITAQQAGDRRWNPAPNVSRTFNISAWTIQGFYQPIDMPNGSTMVWNTVKGGSTVPLKFNVYVNGVQQTTTSVVQNGVLSIYRVQCSSGVEDALTASELVTVSGNTGLRFDGSQLSQNWQVPKQAGFCYAVQASTLDGTSITAYLKAK